MRKKVFYLLSIFFLVIVIFLLESYQFKLTILLIVFFITAFIFPFQPLKKLIKKIALLVSLACLITVIFLFPRRNYAINEPLQSVFLDKQGKRISQPLLPYLLNVFPERDLAKLSLIAAKFFPFPTDGVILEELREQKAIKDNIFIREYSELYKKENIGQVTPFQLLKGGGFYKNISHYYLYVPENNNKKLPLIIFLHGYMGNFQIYWHYFSDLGCVVLCPSSYDLKGSWSEKDIQQIVKTYLAEIEKTVTIDKDNIHLVGLSNGGSGVNAALKSYSKHFKTFTFISTSIHGTPPEAVRHKQLCAIYGDKDYFAANNVEMSAYLRSQGFNISTYPFANERHFVMLTQRKKVKEILKSVLRL